jgi:hypothetical protein
MLKKTGSDGAKEVALSLNQPHHLINQIVLLVIPLSIPQPK